MARRKRSNPPAHEPPPPPERPVLGEIPTLVRLEREVEEEFRPAMLAALENKVKALGEVQPAPALTAAMPS